MISNKTEIPESMPMSERKRFKQRMHILRLLYKKGALSASSLSKKINISLPTTRTLLDELIRQEVICPSGTGKSIGGRKPQIYTLAGDSCFVLAIELGHYKANAVISNSQNQWLTPVFQFETTINDSSIEQKIELVFNELLRSSAISKSKIEAIGISMPGLIDSENGLNKTIQSPKLRAIAQRISEYFGIQVFIENDARMQALGEFEFGAARNTQNSLVINWSWGLGLGMVLNGKIYNGASGNSGELSHIRLLEEGDLCECGKRGCFQTIAGARSLVEMAREEIAHGTISQLTTMFGAKPEQLTPDTIIDCAQKGDELSIHLLNRIGTRLAWGLSILIQLHNPELIVLNGPLSRAGQYVLMPIRQALNQYCLQNILENVRVEFSEAGEYAGLKGVTAMVYNRLFVD